MDFLISKSCRIYIIIIIYTYMQFINYNYMSMYSYTYNYIYILIYVCVYVYEWYCSMYKMLRHIVDFLSRLDGRKDAHLDSSSVRYIIDLEVLFVNKVECGRPVTAWLRQNVFAGMFPLRVLTRVFIYLHRLTSILFLFFLRLSTCDDS